jgi:hypothetical protein
MKKLKTAMAKIVFEYDYTDIVNQMIEDGDLNSKYEIKEYLQNQIVQDITEDIVNNPDFADITIKVQ